MSWDGILFRAPADASVNDLPNDFQMSSLGTTGDINEVLRRLFPQANHCLGQCCIEGDDFWVELNFGYPKNEDLRTSIGVRCNAGLGAIPVLRAICEAFSARLFDNQAGDFADWTADTPSSMTEFAAWRDRAFGETGDLRRGDFRELGSSPPEDPTV